METSGSARARPDYAYRRVGTANLFMITAPFEGWRHVQMTARHTQLDFAQILKDLMDVHFPQAMRITWVCDNLNTHKPSVLYERCEAATARRIPNPDALDRTAQSAGRPRALALHDR